MRTGAPVRGLVLVLASACGTGPIGDSAPDGGAPDAGFEGPTPPEPPRVTPCPEGWREVVDPEDPTSITCDPWPGRASADCGPDEALFPGEPACRRIGTECPAGDYATDFPAGATVLHVMAGAPPGGDGSVATPYNRIGSALVAASDGDVIALSKGTFDEAIVVQDPVVIWGACVAETRIASSVPNDVQPTVAFILRGGATLRNVTVSGERPGMEAQAPASPVRLESVVVSAPRVYGILADTGGTLVGEDLVVRDVRADAVGDFGVGLEIQMGSRVELTRAAFERNRTIGINVVGEGTTLAATAVVVRGTESRTSDGTSGLGLQVWSAATAEMSVVAFEGNHGTGILASGSGSRIEAVDLVVRDTLGRGNDGEAGSGVQAGGEATLEIARATIERNRTAGILVVDPGSALVASDAVVRDTEASTSGEGGYGLDVYGGGSAEIARVVLARNRGAGIVTHDTGTLLTASDTVVHGTREREIDDDLGVGIAILLDAHVAMSRTAVVRNRAFGIAAAAQGNGSFDDLLVQETLETACAGIGDCTGDGTGVGAYDRAVLSVTQFRLTGNALCGVQLSSEAEIDLRQGEVSSNAIGANIQAPSFDISRLQDGVRYIDNGRDLDSSALPLSDALTSLGP